MEVLLKIALVNGVRDSHEFVKKQIIANTLPQFSCKNLSIAVYNLTCN